MAETNKPDSGSSNLNEAQKPVQKTQRKPNPQRKTTSENPTSQGAKGNSPNKAQNKNQSKSGAKSWGNAAGSNKGGLKNSQPKTKANPAEKPANNQTPKKSPERNKPAQTNRPAPNNSSQAKKASPEKSTLKTGSKTTTKTAKSNPQGKTPPKTTSPATAKKRPSTSESKLKIIPLGGLGEIGKNMTVIQYDNSIIVVDAGIMFPEDELLGIDMVIPDYTYLQENRDKIRAFIISHGHEDHIGAVPYMVREFPNVPIYGSKLTLGLIKCKLQEHRLKTKMIEVRPLNKVQIGPFVIEPIRVAHSIPDSLGYAIHTPLGILMMMTDFKLDMTPIDGQQTDIGSISRLGQQGVLLLMMDSTNVEKEGFTPSERTIGHTFDKILLSATGRVIITSFASNVHRIQQAIWAAEKCGRKVAISGRGMQNVSTISKELNYLDIPKDILIDPEKADLLPPEKVLILTTGSQGEPLSGLARMSTGEHRQIHLVPGDLVVISATPVPGNERLVGRTIDNLYRLGANVIYERAEGIHVSGHANREELRLIMNIVKPKYFVPMHGEYRMLYKHTLLAQSLGIPPENTFVMENGQVLEVNRRRCRVNGQVTAGRILIDGFGVGDVGNAVLRERKMLSEGGVLVVNIIYSKKTGKIIHGPEIFSKGFIFEKDSEHIIGEAKNRVASICTKNTVNGKVEWTTVRNQLRTNLGYFINDRIGRRPIVVPVISEV